jgi:hypothetical protein
MKKNRQNQTPASERSTGDTGTARDREMGRDADPRGDLGRGNETWKPPAGEQGISNRPDDEGMDTTSAQSLADDDDAEFEETDDEYEDEGDGFEEDDDSSGRPA